MSPLPLPLRRALRSLALASFLLPVTALAQDNAATTAEKCEKPYGAIAIHEPQNDMIMHLRRYKLDSPTGLIRMMVQQSNCFQVLERGVAMQNLQQEREIARSGAAQSGSNMGDGQMRVADYVLTPAVVFSEGNAGGIGGALGGFVGGPIGAIAGGLKFKEAQTSMLIADVRSSVQVAAAEGKATKKDFSIGALGWAGAGLGALGGYTNTNEGKVVAASFLDNFNKIVIDLRKSGLKPMSGGAGGGSGDNVKAGAVFNEGDVLRPKIDNVKLLAEPKDGAKSAASVSKNDELVFLGDEKEGYVHVQGSNGEGWVKKTLVEKRR